MTDPFGANVIPLRIPRPETPLQRFEHARRALLAAFRDLALAHPDWRGLLREEVLATEAEMTNIAMRTIVGTTEPHP